MVNGSLVFQIKFCGKIPALLVAAKRLMKLISKLNNQKMKKFIFILLATIVLFSCQETTKSKPEITPIVTESESFVADSTAIANLVHDFYKWYDSFLEDKFNDLNFTDDNGMHLKLDIPKLNAYYDHFKNSGLVSDEFIKYEIEYYKDCEAEWQNEEKGDLPACFDYDKYICGQDWDPKVYTTAPIAFKIEDVRRVYVTMPVSTEIVLGFIVKKVNGKWLLETAGCGDE